MIILNTATDIIRISLSAATAVDILACFVDTTAAATTGGNQLTQITATATIVASPAASTERVVKYIHIQAAGGANNIGITFERGATIIDLFGNPTNLISLAVGESLQYTDTEGWRKMTSAGKIVFDVPTGGGGSTPSGTGFRHVTAGVEDAASKLVDTADVNNDQITYAKLQNVGAQAVVGNPTGAGADAQDLTIATDSIVARFGGNVGSQTAAVQSTFIKAAGNLFNATCAAGQALGRTAAGADLGFTNFSTLGLFTSAVLRSIATGTYTPTSGMKFCLVILTGGGGGGGGADNNAATAFFCGVGGGGGGGGTSIGLFTAATIGASQAVTVGAAGTAGSATNGTAGGTGGNSTFGALLTANGGVGGVGSGLSTSLGQVVDGGAGGTAATGTFNTTGGDGHDGWAICVDAVTNDSKTLHGGHGGASFWGGGSTGPSAQSFTASGGTALTTAGTNGKAIGSGGSGALCSTSTTGAAGGTGVAGVCFVLEFI